MNWPYMEWLTNEELALVAWEVSKSSRLDWTLTFPVGMVGLATRWADDFNTKGRLMRKGGTILDGDRWVANVKVHAKVVSLVVHIDLTPETLVTFNEACSMYFGMLEIEPWASASGPAGE